MRNDWQDAFSHGAKGTRHVRTAPQPLTVKQASVPTHTPFTITSRSYVCVLLVVMVTKHMGSPFPFMVQ